VDIPDYGRRPSSHNTLHLSLTEELVKQLREVAYRKRRPISHLCRFLIESGLEKLAAEDPEVAAAMSAARAPDGPGGMDRRSVRRGGRRTGV